MSQPRNLIDGHITSAFIGITVYEYISLDISILAAPAVSLSIVVMRFARVLHLPGGATALIAVIGSEDIYGLGYMFVLSPIAAGAVIMLIVTLIVNNMLSDKNRYYPRYWL